MILRRLPPPKRVLIVKPSALGDVVTALPVLHGLRRTFPETHIAWLVSTACADVLLDQPGLDDIVLFDRKRLGRCWRSPEALRSLSAFFQTLRRGRYDWAIDLQGLFRSGLFTRWTGAVVRAGFADAREGAAMFYTHHVAVSAEHTVDRNLALARVMGIDARGEDVRLHISPDSQAFAEAWCRDLGLSRGGFLVCVPPTRWTSKLYPVRHWRRVAAGLAERMPVLLIGSPDPAEHELCRQIAEGISGVTNLAGRTTIRQMAGLLAISAGVVCCDSAAKFIAAAVGVECVVLIGPTHPERTGPYRRGRAFVADVPCQGCLQKRCTHGTCMESLPPSLVLDAADAMIRAGAS